MQLFDTAHERYRLYHDTAADDMTDVTRNVIVLSSV